MLAMMSTATMFATEEAITGQTNTTAETLSANVPYIWRGGKDFYVGKTVLTKEECQALLKLNCPEAFRQYNKGQKLIKAGWSVFGVGMFLTLVAWTPLAVPNPYEGANDIIDPDEVVVDNPLREAYWDFENACILSATTLLVSGGVLMGSSIPVLCVGYTNRNESVMTYNKRNAKQEPAITYHLTAGQNGVGFAVNF